MKKLIGIAFFGGAALIIAYGIRQAMLLTGAAYAVIKTKVNSIALSNIDIILYLQLTNNSDLSAQIYDQNYNVFINDTNVSLITSKDLVHINSNGNTVIPIAIKVDGSQILKIAANNLSSLLNDKSKIKIEVKGSLSLELGVIKLTNFPIDITYTLQDIIDMSKSDTTTT